MQEVLIDTDLIQENQLEGHTSYYGGQYRYAYDCNIGKGYRYMLERMAKESGMELTRRRKFFEWMASH